MQVNNSCHVTLARQFNRLWLKFVSMLASECWHPNVGIRKYYVAIGYWLLTVLLTPLYATHLPCLVISLSTNLDEHRAITVTGWLS